jgi:uncharacterized protein (TIGR02266 family)
VHCFTWSDMTEDHLARQSEQRRHRRAYIHRVSVRYELAPGRFIVSDALEMSLEGLFISASKPLPVGRLFEIEIRVMGEPLPLAAVGRVVWARNGEESDGKPTGMGVRLIDLDDASRALIGRLVAGRQETLHGLGPHAFTAPPVAVRARGESEWPKLYPRGSHAAPSSPAVQELRATQPSIPFELVTRKVPSAAARTPGRSSDGTRLLAAAALLALVAFGPRDSAGAASRRRPSLLSASPAVVGLPPAAVAPNLPIEGGGPAPSARPAPAPAPALAPAPIAAPPSADPGTREARREPQRP